MKKVLIIVYYWPPTGGSGVQRWVKFVKHLRSFGWEPVIYTPENPNVLERDETFLKEIPPGIEVIKTPVIEMSKLFGLRDTTNRSNQSPSLFSRIKKSIGSYIRGNWFIPDPRVLWVKPSVTFLSEYLKTHKIDAIASSGPPHSLHLTAMQIARKHGIPWLADFRDPWLEILNFHGFEISNRTLNKHKALLNEVINSANAVVTVHESIRKKFQQQTKVPVRLITNGYDADDMKAASTLSLDKTKLNLVFVGIFYGIRNSIAFWHGLNELINEDQYFKSVLRLIFVGKIHSEIMNDLEKYGLLGYCEFTGYVDHSVAVSYEKEGDTLLLFTPALEEFKYEIPGKLFEYLAARKPILCLANQENDSAQIILKMKAGYIVHPENREQIKGVLRQIAAQFRKGELKIDPEGCEQYERKNLTEKLVEELNRIAK